ncbi:MAG: hypothetical protein WAL30_02895 [Candidatus Aquirickettsiella sp.]
MPDQYRDYYGWDCPEPEALNPLDRPYNHWHKRGRIGVAVMESRHKPVR